MFRLRNAIITTCWLVIAVPWAARAEVAEIRAAQQYGLSYLPLMIMEDSHLLEKHAKSMGLGDVKVSWAKLGGPGAMNDALLAGDLDFGTGGVPALLTLWDKTKGTAQEVRGVGALNNMPVELITTNPTVKTLRDFTDKDKIAVTTIKVSTQALLLEMACAKEFGADRYGQLDVLTVSMAHPDAMIALTAGSGAITAHFSAPPFQYQELAKPGARAILNSYDILGGPSTFNVVWASAKFRDANPKTYAAFVAALEEATATINRDKRAAAEVYKRMTKTTETVEDLQKVLDDPRVEMTMTPNRTMGTAVFMQRIGRIKDKPSAWTDIFFADIHNRQGS
jgi:NitT/TauT family transport system substrate-binding protein